MSDTTTHDVMVAQTEKTQELIDYFQGQRDTFSQDVAAAEARFDGFADDLNGVVLNLGDYRATLDPNEANPTNVRGGTFNTLDALIEASPVGARVDIMLPAGADFTLSDLLENGAHTSIEGRIVKIRPADIDAGATLRFDTYVEGTTNYFNRINIAGGLIYFNDMSLVLNDRADAGLSWSSSYGGPIRSIHNFGTFSVWMRNCAVSGSDGASMAVVNGSNVAVSAIDSSLDGDMKFMSGLNNGVATLATRNVTLSNGATMTDGSETLGTNFLKN